MFGKKNRKLSHKASSSFPPKDSYSIIEKKSDALDSFFFSSGRIFSLPFDFPLFGGERKKKTQWSRSTAEARVVSGCALKIYICTRFTHPDHKYWSIWMHSLPLGKEIPIALRPLKYSWKFTVLPFLHLERLLAEGQLRAALAAAKKREAHPLNKEQPLM